MLSRGTSIDLSEQILDQQPINVNVRLKNGTRIQVMVTSDPSVVRTDGRIFESPQDLCFVLI